MITPKRLKAWMNGERGETSIAVESFLWKFFAGSQTITPKQPSGQRQGMANDFHSSREEAAKKNATKDHDHHGLKPEIMNKAHVDLLMKEGRTVGVKFDAESLGFGIFIGCMLFSVGLGGQRIRNRVANSHQFNGEGWLIDCGDFVVHIDAPYTRKSKGVPA